LHPARHRGGHAGGGKARTDEAEESDQGQADSGEAGKSHRAKIAQRLEKGIHVNHSLLMGSFADSAAQFA